MPLDTSDIQDNDVGVTVYGRPPLTRRDKNTIVLHLAQDEVLTLIADLAGHSWDGNAHLVIEADKVTFPRTVNE